ncbi:median body protein-like isoform X3 [Hydractinia symbiolongicarpus]|uniref:median body protein-like isoform X3 n=1 Tax=Hydractinia symbiolongicarpus TaxID=13093 RepID=UPI00254C22F6|nr:median body protein-like isoform X3 [Hydractinia symbiolongicarpus]
MASQAETPALSSGSVITISRSKDCDTRELLKTTYGAIKTRLCEITEELKMRRRSDQENEARVNQLITEKFEIKRTKDEEISSLSKAVDDLKQEKMQLQKEFDEKMKMHEEDKAAQNISINSSSKGIKSLKDEILALQLGKYNLEKKLKDQEYQLQYEVRSKEETGKKISELQTTVKDFQHHCQDMQTRLDYLSNLVIKTEQMHQKLIGVNEHHKCVMRNYQTMLSETQNELILAKAEVVALKERKVVIESEEVFPKSGDDEKPVVRELFLMTSLAESNHMLSTVQSKLNDAHQLNSSFQLQIDDLNMETEELRTTLKIRDEDLESLKTKLGQHEEEGVKMKTRFNEKIRSLESENSALETSIEMAEKKNREQIDEYNKKILQMEFAVNNKVCKSAEVCTLNTDYPAVGLAQNDISHAIVSQQNQFSGRESLSQKENASSGGDSHKKNISEKGDVLPQEENVTQEENVAQNFVSHQKNNWHLENSLQERSHTNVQSEKQKLGDDSSKNLLSEIKHIQEEEHGLSMLDDEDEQLADKTTYESKVILKNTTETSEVCCASPNKTVVSTNCSSLKRKSSTDQEFSNALKYKHVDEGLTITGEVSQDIRMSAQECKRDVYETENWEKFLCVEDREVNKEDISQDATAKEPADN